MKTVIFKLPEENMAGNPVTDFMDNPSVKVISTQIVMVPMVQVVYESLSDPEAINRAAKYESLIQKRLCRVASSVITKDSYTRLKNAAQKKEYLLAFEGIAPLEADRVIDLAKPEMEAVRKKLLEE